MQKLIILISALLLGTACSSKVKNASEPLSASPQPVVKAVEQPKPASAPAPTPSPKVENKFITKKVCEMDSDKRTIEIQKHEDGCEVVYTKMGSSNVVASSKSGMEHCKNCLEKISKNLSDAHFNCQ